MDERLRRWVEETLGGPVVQESRGFAGGSRELWFVEVDGTDGVVSTVLRTETGAGVFADTQMSLEREAVVYQALEGTTVPVPKLLGATTDGSAILLERVPGSSRTYRLPDAEAAAALDGLIDAIGALHSLDIDALDLPGFVRPSRPEDHALVDLDRWRALGDSRLPSLDPMLAFAFGWLAANPPPDVQRTVLVQGDTGPGNFVADSGVVTGLVDWELSHLGDPMDDIAWLDMRILGSGLPADPVRRDDRYSQVSGLTVDDGAVRYYAAFVRLRCALTTALTLARGGGALGLVAYRAPHHRFLVQLGFALADAMGTVVEPIAAVEGDESADTSMYDHAIEGLVTEVVPSLTDPLPKLHARAALLTLEHLRADQRLASTLADAEADDRRSTLGSGVAEAELEELAFAAGSAADMSVLGWLFRRAQRQLAVWATPSVGESLAPQPVLRPQLPLQT